MYFEYYNILVPGYLVPVVYQIGQHQREFWGYEYNLLHKIYESIFFIRVLPLRLYTGTLIKWKPFIFYMIL